MYKKLAWAAFAVVCIIHFAFAGERNFSSPDNETRLLSTYPRLFSREGTALNIFLEGGSTKVFTDLFSEKRPADTTTYWLDSYYADVGYVLIRSKFWHGEGQSFELLNLRSGEIVEVGGYPTLSPDKSRFAIEMEDISAGYFENLLAIYKITPKGLMLEFKLTPKDWGISNIRWNNKLQLTFTESRWSGADVLVKRKKHLHGTSGPKNKITWVIQ